jgi:hypothetical protein
MMIRMGQQLVSETEARIKHERDKMGVNHLEKEQSEGTRDVIGVNDCKAVCAVTNQRFRRGQRAAEKKLL